MCHSIILFTFDQKLRLKKNNILNKMNTFLTNLTNLINCMLKLISSTIFQIVQRKFRYLITTRFNQYV